MSLPGKQPTQSSAKSTGFVRKDTPYALVKDESKKTKDNLADTKIPEVTRNLGSESATSNPIKIERKIPSQFSAVYASPETKSTKTPGQQKLDDQQKVNVAVPRQRVPVPAPAQDVRPLVLATHLVPSLPVGLFELVAEAVEAATQLPVSILYESRSDRSVAKDVADFAILPAYSEWKEGDFFPITFVFAHRLNDDNLGNVYVDIIVAADRAEYVKDIMDLRGHRCAMPDRRQRRGAASLLLGDLKVKGESPAFFGNVLDSGSQVAALQMVAGKQAEVGVVEAPVLACHRRKMPGVGSLHILGSLGPLPPYTIYVKKSVSADLREKISSYLLNLNKDDEWLDRFSQYGVIGFTKNSSEAYIINEDEKEVATSVRYY